MYDVVCFSHLRWQFVFQRPQHLLTRFGRERRVLYVEEPIYSDQASHLSCHQGAAGVEVLTPVLRHGMSAAETERVQAAMVKQALVERSVKQYVLWFYTPMALSLALGLEPLAIVYDCMDELSAFKGASLELVRLERTLIAAADVVFTGGYSLYEAKRGQHPNMHPFPSSVDVAHFAAARGAREDPADQARIPSPRFGFCGVIDERMNLALLDGIALARPDFSFVLVGPVAKIERHELPVRPNLHYLGAKSYAELPAYIGGWNVGIMPFAKNAATEFISPTKTPEYLAAGKPVVSTSITDVVRTYGVRGLCRIADTVDSFVVACERALLEEHSKARLERVDEVLASMSWDQTWKKMADLVEAATRADWRRRGLATRAQGSAFAGQAAVSWWSSSHSSSEEA
jgi:glycosyltransferase involved in cell wall biosynthesis